MDQSPDVNLEEVFWRSPQHVQMMGGFLHSNNILFYFAESPFFDATSNNASLAIQANYNEAFRHFLETREVFEGRLKTMQGLEFMVTYDPLQDAAQSDTEFAHPPSNIWVIRKQQRQKRPGMEDDVVVLSTYYIVGDSVYMAPSVSSIVGNRILSAVTSLTKLLTVASPLPIFTPSYGHMYMPPGPKALDGSQTSSQSQSQSQLQSKEFTPVPDSQGSTKPPLTSATNVKDTSYQDTRNLMEAMNLLSKYGDEFMDETPLSGEPGSFILTKANEPAGSTRQPPKTNMHAPALPRKTGIPSITEASTPVRGAE
ncbi:putative RNA polymerase II transcription mediator complex subunit [Talaromyces proteolyticus]|uniref:Mediator of RNA polymerase II transcription subunit 6 n=1 Tax=Talaromyces proteolyticus TaxID=1131652 RepID=A0AAD4KFA0_9EURO|nr:putative RNA polymerase II transcription mediator complex subunit [Talaromyces proteolyticus]KAH8689575.1 putative RNA polymerase II transcription mediator complex subunit [Talaromyces proteolyticus]